MLGAQYLRFWTFSSSTYADWLHWLHSATAQCGFVWDVRVQRAGTFVRFSLVEGDARLLVRGSSTQNELFKVHDETRVLSYDTPRDEPRLALPVALLSIAITVWRPTFFALLLVKCFSASN